MFLLTVSPILTYIVTSIYYISKYSNINNINENKLYIDFSFTNYNHFVYLYSILKNMIIQSLLVYYVVKEPENYFNIYDIINIPPLLVINDLLFGGFHYLCHKYKFLWKYHSQHHKLTHNFLYGYNAQYSSIPDHVLTSLLPVYLAAYVFNLSYISMVIWFCFAEYNSVVSHLPFGYHSLHHIYPDVNYGTSLAIFDKILYTKK